MKLTDIKPDQLVVAVDTDGRLMSDILYRGLANQKNNIAFRLDNGNRIGVDEFAYIECRPVKDGEELVFSGGVLRLNQPAAAKVEGVHPSELKVGQLGRILSEGPWELVMRMKDRFTEPTQGYYLPTLAPTTRVHPYPIGSKIVPQPDGSIVVEGPEAKALALNDLKPGDWFADSDDCVWKRLGKSLSVCLSQEDGEFGDDYTPHTDSDFFSGWFPIRRLTPAEAAAIIAKAGE